jgi:hypothetical protein
MFPHGLYGIAAGILTFPAIWILIWLRTKGDSFHFDALGEKGAFEKVLPIYIDLVKFALGLSTGSIVLLVGTSTLHQGSHLPSTFASPLFLLVASVFYGLMFMVLR